MGLLTVPQTIFHLPKVGGCGVLFKMNLTLVVTEKIKGTNGQDWMAGPLPKSSHHHYFNACFSFLCIQMLPNKIGKFRDSSKARAEDGVF